MGLRPTAVFVAEGVAVDGLTSRLTIFNVIDAVFVQALPARLGKLFVVVTYELVAESVIVTERVRLQAPDHRVLMESEAEIETVAREPNQMPNGHRSIHAMWNLKLSELGDHVLSVEHKRAGQSEWISVARTLVTVTKAPYPFFVPLQSESSADAKSNDDSTDVERH
ncbi:DUF6941 family protein [Myxococcus fulvus]|uniref:DUF6941 family protein n=1 Tax=Myxococcus fulvus TaxID=33 RepID=UPI003B9AFB61